MTTQQLSADVISAPLAAIDRRALSQAWYSALHVAQRQAPATRPPRRIAERTTAPSPAFRTRPNAPTVANEGLIRSRRHPADERRPLAGAVDRRSPKSKLAANIERMLLRSRTTVKRATLAVEARGARVHVVVQTTRSGARLIAMCPPRVRDAVERALAQARFALAARGIEVETCS